MKKINQNGYKEVYKWQYGAYPFFTSVYLKSASGKLKNKYYNDYRTSVNIFKNGISIFLQPKKELSRVGAIIIKEILSGNRRYSDEMLLVHEEVNLATKLCSEAKRKGEFRSLEKWWLPTQKALSHVTGMLFCFDFPSEKFLNDLKEKNKEEFEVLSANIYNKKLSFMDEAGKYLVGLNKEYPNNFHKVYLLFMEKFGWFQNNYEGVFKITEIWLKKYLENIKNRDFKSHRSVHGKNELPKKYRFLVELINEAIIFKDDKKKLLLIAVDLMELWLKDVCRKNGWKFDELRWLTIDEVLRLVKSRKSDNLRRAKMYSRDKMRFGLMTGEGYDDFKDKQVLAKIIKQEMEFESVKEIKGSAASSGSLRGYVRVILDARKDSAKFKKGEILVTSMTRPEYLPLMSMASAFVTDEGGIACHAAIIAREMKKPCIIGTKIATKVLHDGDLVEVDANKGIVKILKKK